WRATSLQNPPRRRGGSRRYRSPIFARLSADARRWRNEPVPSPCAPAVRSAGRSEILRTALAADFGDLALSAMRLAQSGKVHAAERMLWTLTAGEAHLLNAFAVDGTGLLRFGRMLRDARYIASVRVWPTRRRYPAIALKAWDGWTAPALETPRGCGSCPGRKGASRSRSPAASGSAAAPPHNSG